MKASLQKQLTSEAQSLFRKVERLLCDQGYASLPRPLQRACNGAAILRQELDPPKKLNYQDVTSIPHKSAPVHVSGRYRPAQEIRLSKATNAISRKRRRKNPGGSYFA